MTTNHVDQLAEWWESAEKGIGKVGDVVIERDDSPNFETPSYTVFTLGRDEHENLTYRRILARAPKPKPAWHDAKAVIASTDYCERQMWERDSFGWCGTAGDTANTEDLRDVTPLIEAKVTDEMVLHALNTSMGLDWPALASFHPGEVEDMRCALTAALGLETT